MRACSHYTIYNAHAYFSLKNFSKKCALDMAKYSSQWNDIDSTLCLVTARLMVLIIPFHLPIKLGVNMTPNGMGVVIL